VDKFKISFEREWIEEKKKELKKNPIRAIERFVSNFEGVKLLNSSYTNFSVEIEEGRKSEFLDGVEDYVKEALSEECVWNFANVYSDAEGDITPKTDYAEKKEKPREKAPEESTKAKPAEAEPQKPEEEVPEVQKPKTEEEQPEAEEIAKENTKEPEEEHYSVSKKWYSEEMQAHVEELNKAIPMLKRMNAEECIWGQNLLVSIDHGFGYTTFLKRIAETYCEQGLGVLNEDSVKEIEIKNYSDPDKKYSDWQSVLSRAVSMAEANKKKSGKLILSMDISSWQTELKTPMMREYLRKIAEAAENFICVFRVPFMEGQVVRQIEEILGDVMSVKTIVVAPLSTEDMVAYMRKELYKRNCMTDDTCKEALEQWILQEKQDAGFYGYKSLNKMVKQLIYKKALLNSEDGTICKEFTAKDIKTMLTEENRCDDPEELLKRLIGIATVKQKLQEIIIQIKTQMEFAEKGSDVERPCIHMMFTGNPGTGKTTVARILAKMMKKAGILRKGLFYEINGRNLCGQYVGETAPKTSTYCRDAYGSVLFIDEAYSLYERNMGRDYGKEAIQTLIAEMENHRDDLCVIMAGYKEEMGILMEANPGLESRIPYVIDFPNYTREELEQIFFLMLDGKFVYEDSLKEAVRDFFASIPDEVMTDKTFSNARLVRNLFERVWGKAAYRRSLNPAEELTIRKEDLLCASEEGEFKKMMEQKTLTKIGFF